MKEKIKQKGFIQIPVLIAIILGTIGLGIGIISYIKINQYRNFQGQKVIKGNQKLITELDSSFSTSSTGINVVASASAVLTTPAPNLEIEVLRKEIEELKKKTISNLTPKTLSKPEPPAPIISSPEISFINPAILVNSNSNIVQINGSGFEQGVNVKSGNTYLELATNFNPNPIPNLIYVNVPQGVNPGKYDITVINPDGGSTTLTKALTINASVKTESSGLSTQEIVARIKPSTVLVRTDSGCGSGMVIDRNQILTNNHVVKNVISATIYLNDGSEIIANVIAKDDTKDLALLAIPNDKRPHAVTFKNSSEQNTPQGSKVIALGFPLTCNINRTLIIEEGIITGRRYLSEFPTLGELLQSSARIHAGNSGGPLVNQEGLVVGINTIGEGVFEGYNLTGISYAIQSNTIQEWLLKIKSR